MTPTTTTGATRKPTASTRKPRATKKPSIEDALSTILGDTTAPAATTPARTVGRRATRQPTGRPSWPVLGVSGPHKSGKTYVAAQASASDLIDRTFWVGYGEKDPDEYGALPGARFEYVDHDGTTTDVRDAIRAAMLEPRGDKPHLLVIDSGSRYYDTLRENAGESVIARGGGQWSEEDWRRVNAEWFGLLALARQWDGPVIITARTGTTQVTENGRATAATVEKVQGHHAFAFDVDGMVELVEPGLAYLGGLRSVVMPETRGSVTDFTFDRLWRDMGLADLPVGTATYATPKVTGT